MKRKIPVIILLVLFVIVFSYNEKYQIQHVDYNMLTIVPLTETDLQINDKKIIKFSLFEHLYFKYLLKLGKRNNKINIIENFIFKLPDDENFYQQEEIEYKEVDMDDFYLNSRFLIKNRKVKIIIGQNNRYLRINENYYEYSEDIMIQIKNYILSKMKLPLL